MKTVEKKVSLEVTGADGQKKEFTRNFVTEDFENSADVLNALQDEKQAKYVVECYNYANDLKIRAQNRAILAKEAEGPEKQFESMVKALVKYGIPEAVARVQVKSAQEAAKTAATA